MFIGFDHRQCVQPFTLKGNSPLRRIGLERAKHPIHHTRNPAGCKMWRTGNPFDRIRNFPHTSLYAPGIGHNHIRQIDTVGITRLSSFDFGLDQMGELFVQFFFQEMGT